MSLRLSGINPLAYMGVEPFQPPQLIVLTRPPTQNDTNFNIGTFWVVNAPQELWILLNLDAGIATWAQLFPGTGGGGASEFITDAGDAIENAGILNIRGGSNINTSGSGNTVVINLNDAIFQPDTTDANTGTYNLGGERFLHNFGDSNTFVGKEAGNFTLNPAFPPAGANTGVGSGSLFSLVNSDSNSALGAFSLFACTDGDNSCAIGTNSLSAITTGRINDALGANTGIAGGGPGVVTGSFNIFIGGGDSVGGIIASGGNYTSSESSNILIRSAGLQGEDNTIRIGTQGSSNAQQDTCFIAGIFGSTVDATNGQVFVDNTGKLGTIGGGGGVGNQAFLLVQASNSPTIAQGVLYTIGTGTALTTVFDNGGNVFAGDGIGGAAVFTAPITGQYLLTFHCSSTANSAIPIINIQLIITSSRTYRTSDNINQSAANPHTSEFVVCAEMTAGDTAQYNVQNSYSSGNGYIVSGPITGQTLTWISGFIIT